MNLEHAVRPTQSVLFSNILLILFTISNAISLFFIQYFIRQCHLLMAMPINVDVVVVDFAAEKGKNPNPDHRQPKLNMRVRAVA